MTRPSADLRDCHLYRFYVRHPITGERVLGYVGETVRMPFKRLMEHIEAQPWADTILGWEVDDVVYVGKDAVLAAETAAIRAERPLYNIEENGDNPWRIPPWVAREQRAARDAAKGGPRPAVRVPRSRRAVARPPTRPRLTRKQRRARLRLGAYAIGWAVLFGLALWALPKADLPSGPAWSSGAASVLLGGLRFVTLPQRRQRQVVAVAGLLVLAAAVVWVLASGR